MDVATAAQPTPAPDGPPRCALCGAAFGDPAGALPRVAWLGALGDPRLADTPLCHTHFPPRAAGPAADWAFLRLVAAELTTRRETGVAPEWVGVAAWRPPAPGEAFVRAAAQSPTAPSIVPHSGETPWGALRAWAARVLRGLHRGGRRP